MEHRHYEGNEIVHPLIPESMNLMFLFTALLIGTIIRQLLIKFNVPTPYGVFVIFIGGMWGIFAYYNEVARLASSAIYITPRELIHIYIPVLIFNVCFCMDSAIFVKTLPQVVILGGPVYIVTCVTFGMVIRQSVNREWDLIIGILFGVLSSPIYPANIVHLLKKQSMRTKQLSVLLEGEAIFTLTFTNMGYEFIINYLAGIIARWYQFIALFLRFTIIGILTGYIFGLFGRYLIRKTYTSRLSVFVISFGMPFFTYAVSDLYTSGFGEISVAVLGVMMSTERMALANDINKFLLDLWNTIHIVFDIVLCTSCACILVMDFLENIKWQDYVLGIITYLLYYGTRFVSFLLFSPAINKLGYEMDVKNLIVLVWSGLKCPFSLILVRGYMEFKLHTKMDPKFFFHIMGVYFLSNLINGTFTRTLMDFLDLRRISRAKQLNMNNCIKHLFIKREQTIAILKMDRFLADTNWPIVVRATNIRHPYHVEMEDEDEDVFFLGYHFTECPDCQKEIIPEPTGRELKEMTREAKLRILKTKKMCYSRQFENGMISKEAIRILTQSVELAMDTDEAVMETESLKKRFTQEGWLRRFIRNHLRDMKKNKGFFHKRPRKYLRSICYNIVLNKTWEKFMLYVVASHIVILIVEVIFYKIFPRTDYQSFRLTADPFVIIIKICFWILYIVECIMKILAYSWLWIWRHGVRTYFKSGWNIIDFITIIINTVSVIFNISAFVKGSNTLSDDYNLVIYILQWFRIVRICRLIEIFYPKLLVYLDHNMDSKMAFTYELGKSFTTAETEILELLPYMIDNEQIKEELKVKIEIDRLEITKMLGIIQKEKPWVAITVKTKQAIRTILKNMKENIKQLKISGWVDNYEQDKLEAIMSELYKNVNAITTVQPSAPKVIFTEVAWMGSDENIVNFLFENVIVRIFEPGDIVFGDGNIADGIYIVVSGLLMLKYNPEKPVLKNLRDFGELPIVDYLSSTKFEEAAVDYVVSGNCIGELSTLTKRPYNCMIIADSHSQVYVIRDHILKQAMEMDADPVVGLETRIWKEISIRLAIPLLMSVPAYQNFSQDQIKYTLERAFVPNLRNFKIFAVTELIQDIILIEGLVIDFNSREVFTAPMCIPRTVQKLILPQSSKAEISVTIETKLLIIPEKDLDELDVMLTAEETCEMVVAGSVSKCLQHAAQDRVRQRKLLKLRKLTASGMLQKSDRVSTSQSDHRTVEIKDKLEDKASEKILEEKEQHTVDYHPSETKSKDIP